MISLAIASVLTLTPQSAAVRSDYATALLCGGVFRHAAEVSARYAAGASPQPMVEAADEWRAVAYLFGVPLGHDRAAIDGALANQLNQQRGAWDFGLSDPATRRVTLDRMMSEQSDCVTRLRDIASRYGVEVE